MAEDFETPIFTVDSNRVQDNIRRIQDAFSEIDCIIAYPIKTNSLEEVVRPVLETGLQTLLTSKKDFELVYWPILHCSYEKNGSIVHGPYKSDDLINSARRHESLFVVDSFNEIPRLEEWSYGSDIEIGIRVAFEDSKLGVQVEDLEKLLDQVKRCKHVKLTTLHSMPTEFQITDPKKYGDLLEKLYLLAKDKNLDIKKFDLGGGIASETTLNKAGVTIFDFAKEIGKTIDKYDIKQQIILEPGRYIVEDAGYVLAKVVDIKNKWIYLDIGTNFLVPLDTARFYPEVLKSGPKTKPYNFADCISYSKGIIAKDVKSPRAEIGDLVLIKNCGAYTHSMSSDFCTPKPKIIPFGELVNRFPIVKRAIYNQRISAESGI